jgi:RNA polymerase sigma factor (sigma-70 family)
MSADSTALEALIHAAIQGDRAALESLLLHFHDALLVDLRQLVRRSTASFAAEDILQETFTEAFRRIKTVDHRGSAAFYHWLRVIAKTRFLNQIKADRAAKRGGGRRAIGEPAIDQTTATTILGQLIGPDLAPSVIVRRKEAAVALTDAMTYLDPLRRRVVELRYGQGMQIEEIAIAVGKTPGAVKMLLNRAIKDLRRAIASHTGEISVGA